LETATVEDVFEVMPVSTVEAEVRFVMRGDWHKGYAAAVLRRGVETYAAEEVP
jgi:predicted phage gp36 major capsid-like protein